MGRVGQEEKEGGGWKGKQMLSTVTSLSLGGNTEAGRAKPDTRGVMPGWKPWHKGPGLKAGSPRAGCLSSLNGPQDFRSIREILGPGQGLVGRL